MGLGAQRAGRLTALIHTGTTVTSRHNDFPEMFTSPARHLYAIDHVWLQQKVLYLDVVPNTFMRAPGKCPGTFALESAIDELDRHAGQAGRVTTRRAGRASPRVRGGDRLTHLLV